MPSILPRSRSVSNSPDRLHVAVIMDGNGRWASMRGLPRTAGHIAGVRALKRVIDAAPSMGVGTLTVYAFSADNWKRPAAEVGALMDLLRGYLARDVAHLVRSNVRLQMIGRRDRLPDGMAEAIEDAERRTRHGRRLLLRVALDYSSRAAILEAVTQHRANLQEHSTHAELARDLTGGTLVEDVDLLIRTSGEKRLSDFLLWEAAYAELHFTQTHWPDFDACELASALHDYHTRERRFGGLGETVTDAPDAASVHAFELLPAGAGAP